MQRRAPDEGAKERPSPRLQNYARSMRREPTEAERALWLLLRNKRLVDYKFRRQVPIGPYIADFVCYGAKLIIEADGSQHAESQRDVARDDDLRRRGFRLLRLWNNDILADPDVVLDAIWNALQPPSSGAARHLLPPGEKEGTAPLAPSALPISPPSPPVGEGARRADEGAAMQRRMPDQGPPLSHFGDNHDQN
jgi:very-short-patch-repair endonuclease